MPEKAKNSGAVMMAAEIGDYSAFAPGNPDRPAFDPVIPPEDWRLAVRNLIWREDLSVRLRLMDRLKAKTADGPDLFSRGYDILPRPIPDMEAVIAEAAAALDAEQAAVAERTHRHADAVIFVKDPFLKVPSARALL